MSCECHYRSRQCFQRQSVHRQRAPRLAPQKVQPPYQPDQRCGRQSQHQVQQQSAFKLLSCQCHAINPVTTAGTDAKAATVKL